MGGGKNTASLAKQAVCCQTPEVGAVCINVHVRIYAGGVRKLTFLPQPTGWSGLPILRETVLHSV